MECFCTSSSFKTTKHQDCVVARLSAVARLVVFEHVSFYTFAYIHCHKKNIVALQKYLGFLLTVYKYLNVDS